MPTSQQVDGRFMPPYNLAIYHRKHWLYCAKKRNIYRNYTKLTLGISKALSIYDSYTEQRKFSMTIQRYVSRPSCYGQTVPLSTQGREPACPTTVHVFQIFRFTVLEVVIKLKPFIILYRLQLSKRQIERFKIHVQLQAGSHVESGTVWPRGDGRL
jgi:hypothetical protein